MKVAVLQSMHYEVARLSVEELTEIWCMAANPNAEDLIRVGTKNGVLWCDSIEFIDI